jgi:hypothetical protein
MALQTPKTFELEHRGIAAAACASPRDGEY